MARRTPDWLRTRPIAHRGLHDRGAAPENSRAAFARAASAGIPIELDVRPSRDGVPMVFHDATLARVCGRQGTVADLDRRTLASLRLSGTGETIPTLADALAIARGRVPVLVELKHDRDEPPGRRAGPLERAVAAVVEGSGAEVAVQSFSPRSVAWFRRHAPALPRGQLVGASAPLRWDLGLRPGAAGDALRDVWRRMLLANAAGRPDFIAVAFAALTRFYEAYARAQGIPILAWTIRTDTELSHCRARGWNPIFEGIPPSAAASGQVGHGERVPPATGSLPMPGP